jgi:hypothetical protein
VVPRQRQEYRLIDVLKGRTQPLVVPLAFPDAPDVSSPERRSTPRWRRCDTGTSRRPTRRSSPRRACRSPSPPTGSRRCTQFLPNLRDAVSRGLAPDKALAALTTVPAAWLGIERRTAPSRWARSPTSSSRDGDLFTQESAMRDVWVQGARYGVTRPPQVDPRGTWAITSRPMRGFNAHARPRRAAQSHSRDASRLRRASRGEPRRRPASSPRRDVWRRRSPVRRSATRGDPHVRLGARSEEVFGWTSLPERHRRRRIRGKRTEVYEGPARGAVARRSRKIDLPFIRPIHGVRPCTSIARAARRRPGAQRHRVDPGTAGADGERGPAGAAPARSCRWARGSWRPRGAVVIDATGKHVTPGLIDPHSHTGVTSVNESGFAIVPEVRMGDVLTHNSIWMYRQLAGGLTMQMVKHGSANPIGGENVYVKNRWGMLPDEQRFENPPRTVKFALGENPKRSPNALSEHAHGRAGDHPRPLPRRARLREGMEARGRSPTRRASRRVATSAWRRSSTS